MNAKQTCPRRMDGLGPWRREEDLDEWRPDRGLAGQQAIGLSCSFCGSLHQDRFMELVRAGWVVGPTDKNYKAYLGKPVTAGQIADRKASWMAGGIARAIRDLGAKDGKTPEQAGADAEAEWEKRQLPLVRDSCGQEAKFYFQHLSEDQRGEFVDLVNARAVVFGYPGYFYRLPFFITYGD